MANKIPIDDLFRDLLSEGKEQLNLGAWANMDRMLNGQNPYGDEEQEPKNKRRILPFLAIFLLLSSAISAGYVWLNHHGKGDKNKSQITVVSDNKTQYVKEQPVNNNNLTGTDKTDISPTQQPALVANPQTITADLNAGTPVKATSKNRKNKHNKLNKTENTQIADNDKKTGEVLNEGSITPEIKSTVAVNGKVKNGDKVKDGEKVTPVNKDIAAVNPGKKIKNTKRTETIQITTKEKTTKNRNGTVKNTTWDTLGILNNEVVTNTVSGPGPGPVTQDHSTEPGYKYHPRYLGADIQAVEHPLETNATASLPTIKSASQPSLAKNAETKKQKADKDKPGFFKNVGDFTANTLGKAGEAGSNFLRMLTVFDPGISLGVNAALFKAQNNNYGGFHAGLTNHTAISDMFNIITELKFFIRNNSGFTINDIKTSVINKNTDTITYANQNQTMYSYQVDSLTKKYNFKSFMSLELPVMLSARFGGLSVYGGPNFVYNFKLKITEIDKKFVSSKQDIMANGAPYSYPDEIGMQYERSDFGSRFGIGYAAGVSYNFNPKIYLDLRVSKVVWDNTQTNSARAISNGVSKVPFTQLSIGYRFLNKDKD